MHRNTALHHHSIRTWMARAAAALALGAMLGAPIIPAHADEGDRDGGAELLQLIRKARLIDLSHTWTSQSPIASVNPPYRFSLEATHANTRGGFGDGGQLSFTSEIMQWSGQHGAPSIDAIGHIGRDGKLFGGVDAAAATSNPDGIGKGVGTIGAHLAIDRFPNDLLVNRGVLLDVARMVQGDSTPLPATFEITAKHLQDAARQQGVRLRKGDTVLIRTGWGQHFAGNAPLYAGADSPGPGPGRRRVPDQGRRAHRRQRHAHFRAAPADRAGRPNSRYFRCTCG